MRKLPSLAVTQLSDTQWTFKHRNVVYYIERSGKFYEVMSRRGVYPTPPKVLTAEELRAENKTLQAFATLLEI